MTDPVRAAREQLIRVGLTGNYQANDVPDLIVRSWRRSISSAAESAAPQRFREVDTDTLLGRAAVPVLDRWQHQLADTGTTLFLSDRGGSIVDRRASDSSERQRLDNLHAAEGFDYSEDSIGTNALGTSMVEKRPVFVKGSQHYSDALAANACAAAPIYTPAGLVVGSIALGSPVEAANPIMLSLAREISQQIAERLRASSRPQDLALAMSFMRFTSSQRPTVVLDHESVLANTPGLPYVSVASHVMLWEVLNSHDWQSSATLRRELEGTRLEITARRVADGHRGHFVVHFAEIETPSPRQDSAPQLQALRLVSKPALRTPRDAVAVVVDGPVGSGRSTAVDELRAEWGRTCPLETFVPSVEGIPWSSVESLLEAGSDVLLRRIESLADDELLSLREVVSRHGARLSVSPAAGVLFLTTHASGSSASMLSYVEELGVQRKTSALSDTPERIPGLVTRILNDLDPHSRHSISPAALQSLVQWNWPGNVSELVQTLTELLGSVSASLIERKHLPKHLQQAPPRRHLSLIESAERDAIIRAMEAAGGNKSEAAELLGIGRTTLYRRLRQLGLDAGEGSI
ncbi:Transcriptional regulator of acetoin/glycerol metabolism [Arthrobacter sp. yr096]|uniref:helix-turn-helix domain-containing protein n=1 Tax=Arthrobacter sp. yr096 TaxID=1761750 RepID=UPI0008B38DFB|nr:helix-turn-helix domain-containing protein [Arthrobacter sp. yr096]SEI94919.1 Transcriptional regulator of acetoin/glycerol metabolism [Arthrobacter sp. yr096]